MVYVCSPIDYHPPPPLPMVMNGNQLGTKKAITISKMVTNGGQFSPVETLPMSPCPFLSAEVTIGDQLRTKGLVTIRC